MEAVGWGVASRRQRAERKRSGGSAAEDAASTRVWAAIVGDGAARGGVQMKRPTLWQIDQTAPHLPRVHWASGSCEEEKSAA
jgi:hypothetical protein